MSTTQGTKAVLLGTHLQRQHVGHERLHGRERRAYHLVEGSPLLLHLVLVPLANLAQGSQRVKDPQGVRGLQLQRLQSSRERGAFAMQQHLQLLTCATKAGTRSGQRDG